MSPRFVVQEHEATRLHYDFRLEMDGVLRSWAIPKGPSMNPAEKRLAVAVEDHVLEHADYEGIIPEGSYGSGPVVIWDQGSYELLEKGDDKLSFQLKGKKLKGDFALVRLKKSRSGNDWLLMKKKDAQAMADWELKTSLTKKKRSELKEKVPPCAAS
jgi:bifunctional non-homologous end joining protein LigD